MTDKSVLIRLALTGPGVFVLPVTAFASVEPSTAVGVSAVYLIKTVVALCVVLAVIFLLSKLLRSVNSTGKLASGPIRVLAGATIGARERLVIVQAGDTQLLLGIGPAGIVKLEKFDEPVVTDTTISASPFKEQLNTLLGNSGR